MTARDIQRMQDDIDSLSSKVWSYCFAAVSICAVLVAALVVFEVCIL